MIYYDILFNQISIFSGDSTNNMEYITKKIINLEKEVKMNKYILANIKENTDCIISFLMQDKAKTSLKDEDLTTPSSNRFLAECSDILPISCSNDFFKLIDAINDKEVKDSMVRN